MATAINQLGKSLDLALQFLTKKFQKELEQQGHRLTGNLEKSFEQKVTVMLADGVVKGEILTELYGRFLDTGVKARRIPYNPGSGRKSSKYIQGLMKFVRLRGMASKPSEIKSIAFAIARKQKKQGMPTKGSFAFSKNGRRKSWVEATLKETQKDFENLIDFDGYLQAVYFEAFAAIQKQIQ